MLKKLLAACLVGHAALAVADSEQLIGESRQMIKAYAERLQMELQLSLKEEGALAAIEHCHGVAPDIDRELDHDPDWGIGRTALRIRNPQNRPDDWERSVLQQFQRRQQQGEAITDLEYAQIVERNGQRYFRYMKAIPTQALCLTCHGEQLNEQLTDKIERLYPQDRATGFAIGDIRGAFTISRRLD
ncbi:DUF3365 domain-containing protein [Methylomarinum sp. Ch1-1]|uniref:DUF3365 domain-containing protein n=1 Tax=Methylomarinum roseum TaxID=3067653 RepID=A0AAU7NV48_9GAMM|nr:DUF3365 domain-containing protein [Methylomarinum sp. Ch1-1]MDP4519027.1 DUF3365 domain-containing protein [Methylomarinum sp. Ch1-1]